MKQSGSQEVGKSESRNINAADLGLVVQDHVKVNRNWHTKHGGIIYQHNINGLILITTFEKEDTTLCYWKRKDAKKRN